MIEYKALGHTEEEAALLAQHDEGETLHAYDGGLRGMGDCIVCGDTEDGLMHNNTWRNVEPLLVQEG